MANTPKPWLMRDLRHRRNGVIQILATGCRVANVLRSCPNPLDDAKLICSSPHLLEAARALLANSLQQDHYANWRPVERGYLDALQAAVDMATIRGEQ